MSHGQRTLTASITYAGNGFVNGEADLQVFEDTEGVKVGDRVELTRHMLSASLGPGLLGAVYDGLQNPLETLANRDGFFLQRGHYADSLDREHKWSFVSLRRSGDRLRAGDVLGTVIPM